MSISQVLNEDLRAVIDGMDEADLRSFAAVLEGDENINSRLTLYSIYHEIGRRTKSDSDLNIVVHIAEKMLWSIPEESETFALLAEETSELLRARFERGLEIDDLIGAIHWVGEANKVTAAESARFTSQLEFISALSDTMNGIPRNTTYEDISLDILPQVIAIDPRVSEEEDTEIKQSNLANPNLSSKQKLVISSSLRNMFYGKFVDAEVENADCLDLAIAAAETALACASRLRVSRMSRSSAQKVARYFLGKMLAIRRETRYEKDLGGLDLAIDHLEKSDGLPRLGLQWMRLDRLSGLFLEKFELTSQLKYLELSVSKGSEAVRLARKGTGQLEDLADQLYKYGMKLLNLSEATQSMDSLDEALVNTEESLGYLKSRGLLWARAKVQCAKVFLRKFDHTGIPTQLDQGIDYCNSVANSGQPEVVSRTVLWHTLSALLRSRYDRFEVKEDILGAVHAGMKAVDILPTEHKHMGIQLHDLSSMLWRKYQRFGDQEDIHKAIACVERAKSITPKGSVYNGVILSTLSGLLTARYEVTKNVADLDDSVAIAEQAVAQTLKGAAGYLAHRNNLARTLYKHASCISVVVTMPSPSDITSEASSSVHNLQSVSASPRTTGSTCEYLTRAIEVLQSVVADTPPGDPSRTIRLFNLGKMLLKRYTYTGDVDDLEAAADACDQCSQCVQGAPSRRLLAAATAADVHLLRGRFANADTLLRRAVSLLRDVSPRILQQDEQQRMLRQFAGLATLAAAVTLQAKEPSEAKIASDEDASVHVDTGAQADAAEDALRLLEDGRGIILGLVLEMRSDVAELRKKHPDLAADFERLRDELNEPDTSQDLDPDPGVVKPPTSLSRRAGLVEAFDDVVRRIRLHEEFRNFLLPPEVEELKSAAKSGRHGDTGAIVVVNVSRIRSDAFIVQADKGVRHIRLPKLELEKIRTWASLIKSRRITAQMMFELLEWLWQVLASPVLACLKAEQQADSDGGSPPLLQRIWWVPTGPLSSLPIHAAGLYKAGGRFVSSSSRACLLGTVVSSYSPSIKALIFTRKNMARGEGTPPVSPAPLLIGMRETPGCTSLYHAEREVEAVRVSLARLAAGGSESQTDAVISGHTTPTVLHEPDKATVLNGLRAGPTIVHFAGHGRSDPTDPLQSALLTRDWQSDLLTIRDLIHLKMHEIEDQRRPMPFLVYLSACSTGSNQADDLLDESLHLMSACQLVGFRHVVGTLWAASDSHCVDVARSVFSRAAAFGSTGSDAEVPLGVRDGINRLRRQGETHEEQEEHEKNLAEANRDGFNVASYASVQSWTGVDPRLWAPYLHIGP
ncbi:CHAT domain-containing protein [Dactylonectria macrodidyma]|uniref:CHAT domain-containing protein n=1 Tax=Dactylonectria macrodidyma TaxID=307937 RepID=A0A9P9CZY2_9HYPO|nr:CHAT domain-containing protein [Dactylonectria macrodidyma]